MLTSGHIWYDEGPVYFWDNLQIQILNYPLLKKTNKKTPKKRRAKGICRAWHPFCFGGCVELRTAAQFHFHHQPPWAAQAAHTHTHSICAALQLNPNTPSNTWRWEQHVLLQLLQLLSFPLFCSERLVFFSARDKSHTQIFTSLSKLNTHRCRNVYVRLAVSLSIYEP